MGRIPCLAIVAAAGLSACEKPPLGFAGARIDGPYFLVADLISANPGRAVCYQPPKGGCDERIKPRVVAIGWDEDFISAAVEAAGAPGERAYFYIVRDFDGPRADVERAVRGSFSEKEFIEERRKHGVPGVRDLGPAAPAG